MWHVHVYSLKFLRPAFARLTKRRAQFCYYKRKTIVIPVCGTFWFLHSTEQAFQEILTSYEFTKLYLHKSLLYLVADFADVEYSSV